MPWFAWIVLDAAMAAVFGDPVGAARDRQERTRTVVVEYRQVSRLFAATGEVSATADNRVVIDGNRIRVEDNNPGQGIGRLVQLSRIEVFDGAEHRMLHPNGIDIDTHPSATLERTGRASFGVAPFPIAICFRGLDPGFRTLNDGLKATGHLESIDGSVCWDFERENGQSWTHYLIDPARGSVVRRVRHDFEGKTTEQTTIDYREDPTFGWVPAGWRNEHFRQKDGTVRLRQDATITRLVVNAPVEPKEFRLDFPVGTNVEDHDTHRTLRVEADGT
jgi:hypothetical protein